VEDWAPGSAMPGFASRMSWHLRSYFAAACLSFPTRVGAVHEGKEHRSRPETLTLCKHCHTQERYEYT